MKAKNSWWIDALIVCGIVILVYVLCQPIGRQWSREVEEAYTGTEGVLARDVDTYYYLRRAKEFTENGLSSIRVMSSRTEDPLITSIQAGENDSLPNLLSAMAALLWYFLHFLGLNVSIYTLAMSFCSGVLALCTIPVYFFVKQRMSRSAAVVAALFITLAPPFFKHSFCGFFDTDALICLLALVMILSGFECVLQKKKRVKCVYGCMAIAATVLLALTWKVFYVYTVIAVGTAVFAMAVVWLWTRKENKLEWRIPLLFFALMIGLTLFIGGKDIWDMVVGFFQKEPAGEVWPSTSLYVAEMEKLSFVSAQYFWDIFMTTNVDYISYLGGLFTFCVIGVSIVVATVRLIRARHAERGAEQCENLFLYAAIGSWGLGTAIMSLFGLRFMEFLVLPVGMIVAYGFYCAEKYLLKEKWSLCTKRIVFACTAAVLFAILVYGYPKLAVIVAGVLLIVGFFIARLRAGRVLAFLLMAVLLLGNAEGAYLTSALGVPYVERPVEDSMIWIRSNTPENAVVANFWDLGYVYQYYSERRTISDGGTYNGEFFYWLGTMMATPDLKLTAGIVRMLQNSGLDGTNYACELVGGKRAATDLLKEILPMSRQEAAEKLKSSGICTEEECYKLLDYTHPEHCPEIYFVTFYNLFRLAATLDYYYSWDFSGDTKADGSVLLGNYSVELPTEEQMQQVSVWNKGYEYGYSVLLSKKDDRIEGCFRIGDGFAVDFPRTIYIKDGNKVYDRINEESEDRDMLDDEILILLEEQGRLSVVVCPSYLADSALFRLYLFDGIDQNVFTKVYESSLSEAVSKDKSRIQRRIGTIYTREFINCGNSVWKVNFE